MERPDPRIGQSIAGYRIESMLGRGATGVVYRAEEVRLHRLVALKVLDPSLAADEAGRRQFIQESHLAAAIEHPNIVPIHQAGEADGVLFIAMRYVEGTDLATLINSEGVLDVQRVAAIMRQMGGALDAAHAHGLVLRDVKAANVLIAEAPDSAAPDHVYLTDFGFTKRISGAFEEVPAEGMSGSIETASPEQIRGETVDGRADVYGMGCVLFECLTGHAPFDRESPVATLYAHLSESPPEVTALRPDLPIEVNGVVATALAKSPDERYPSATAFAESFANAVGSPPIEEGRRAARRRTRRRVAIAFAALVAVAVTGAVLLLRAHGSTPHTWRGVPVGTIWTISEDASIRSQVVTTVGRYQSPAWSPQGDRIAFVRDVADRPSIFVMNADGTGIRRLTGAAGAKDHHPTWSPDGTKIAFTRTFQGSVHIWIVQADGSGLTQVTNGSTRDGEADWGPGNLIAFQQSNGVDRDIAIIGGDGRNLRRVTSTTQVDTGPAWSPNGTKIAFVRRHGNRDVWIGNRDGTGATNITSNPADDFSPTWSPDGTKIAFVSNRNGNEQIFITDAITTPRQVVRLTWDVRDDVGPNWSSQGLIVFVSQLPPAPSSATPPTHALPRLAGITIVARS